MFVRFLPSQEWFSGERKCAGGFGIVVAHDCEIPAFAGMVCVGMGIGGDIGNCAGDNWAAAA